MSYFQRRIFLLAGLILGALLLFAVVKLMPERSEFAGHKCLGEWTTEPGARAPMSVTYREDGTGQLGSGVGNFSFRWKPTHTSGDEWHLKLTFDPGQPGAPKDGERRLTFLAPDTHQDGATTLVRRKK